MKTLLPGTVVLLAFAVIGTAAETALARVEATLETGSQSGRKIAVTLAYDPQGVAAEGESVVAAQPVGTGLTLLQRAEAVFHDGVLNSVRVFLRLESSDAPIHNIVLGLAGPAVVAYVDQTGGVGTGRFSVTTVPDNGAIAVIRPLTEPQFTMPVHQLPTPLEIFVPQLAGGNPLNLIRPDAAPGLLVVNPAPLTLTLPPPPLL